MGMKEDLEKLILDSYQILRRNDQQILVADPREKLRLQRENEENWTYIKTYLADYTSLCEFLKVKAPEDIIHIAATRFSDLAMRLAVAAKPPLPEQIAPPDIHSAFQLTYRFKHPYMPMDRDQLAQFVVKFSTHNDVPLPQQNVITHVCLVLDVSGSMDEEGKYNYLLDAVPYVIDALGKNDYLSIILFSSESEIVCSEVVSGCRMNKKNIINRIRQSTVKFEDTFLASGLRKAIDEIKDYRNIQPEAVTRLYILTDGQLHDVEQCTPLNNELRRLGLEINSYGFGQDFAEDTMRKIMDGCQGGRVKWVSDTETIKNSFKHVGEVSQNIIATNGDLILTFSPNIIPGDAFRFEPGTHWFNTIDNSTKRFQTHIGALEKERIYTFAFEARIYPSRTQHERIATATLRYSFQGRQQTVKQDILVERTLKQEQYEQVDKEIENIFLVLEGLRSNDPSSKRASLEARLEILRSQGGDPAQIRLLEKAVQELTTEGTLESFSPWELRQLDADSRTTKAPDTRFFGRE